MDLSAAFDCVDHEILLYSMGHSFGIQSKAIKCLTSYLTGQTQCVHLSWKISSVQTMRYRVTHVSVLGPLLFLMYTDDIKTTVEEHKLSSHFYADDSQLYLYCRPNDTQSLRETTPGKIFNIGLWMSSNRPKSVKDRGHVVRDFATYSPDRRRFFPFQWCRCESVEGRPKPRRDDEWRPIDERARQQDRRPVLLIVAKDNINWSFAVHWCYRHLAPSLICSRIDYCNVVFAGLPNSTIDRLQSVLHAAARIIMSVRKYDHTYPERRTSLAAGDATYNIQIVYDCLQGTTRHDSFLHGWVVV